MLGRFGEVLYWGGCIVAGLITVFVAFNDRTIGGDFDWWTITLSAILAGLVWLTGRAAMYVLAAR
jgi:hypothetical protein